MSVEVISQKPKIVEIIKNNNSAFIHENGPLGQTIITNIYGVSGINNIVTGNVFITGDGATSVSVNGQIITISSTGGGGGTVNGLTTGDADLRYYPKNGNPSGYLTGFNSGIFITTGQTGQFYPASNPNQYVNSGNLYQTGSNLDNKINSLSGSSVLLYDNQYINGLKTFYTGINVSGNGIDFLNISDPTWQEGRLFYDTQEKSLAYYNDNSEVKINIGQEEVVRIVNKNGSTITDGDVVYVAGAQGNRPAVKLAIGSSEIADKVIGVVTHTINDNNNGYITVRGIVHNLNTSFFNAGDTVYLSEVISGKLTGIEPRRPNHAVKIGTILNSHVTDGTLFVDPSHISHSIYNLDDTYINTGVLSNGDLLAYNQSSGLWLSQSSFSGVLNNKIEQTGSSIYNLINSFSGGVTSINTKSGAIVFTGAGNTSVFVNGSIITISGNTGDSSSFITRNETGNFYPSSNPNQYVNSGDLYLTGNNLDDKINSLSGYSNNNFYTKNNESGFLNTLSGLSLTYVNSISGDLSNRLGITGQTLLALISSSAAGVGSLNGLSGIINLLGAGNISVTNQGQNITISGNTGAYSSFATVINLGSTGSNLQSQINSLSSNTGNYYLNSNPSGFITGLNTGSFVSISQTGQFYPASNPQNYATSGNLQATGLSLQTQVSAITAGTGNFISTAQTGQFYPASNPQNYIRSGDVSLVYSTLSNLTLTGQTLDSKINSLSGYSDSIFYLKSNPSGYLNTLSGLSTGYITGISGNLQSQINNTNNNLFNSGSNLDSKINSLSGYSNNTFATINDLFNTGNNLQSQLNTLFNNTGNYYPRTNPSGYLTGFNSGLYVTVNETGQFYSTSNPYQYIRSGDVSSTYALISDLQLTGSILDGKINSLSGYANNSFSLVTVTGSNKVLNPNFTGIGGAQVILSGINTILISGGAGGAGGNTTNNYYVNSGSGLFLFRNNLTNGLDKQFITYPISIDYVPLIVAGVHNDISDNLISCQVSGANTTGFWAVFSNVLPNTGYYLDILTCNPVGTGIGISNIIVNNSTNYTTGTIVYVTGEQRSSANFTGVGNVTINTDSNFVYISGNTYFNTLNLNPVKDNNVNINLGISPIYFHTGNSSVIWTLPSIVSCTGRTYLLKNKGAPLTLTGQFNDFIFLDSQINNIILNSGDAFIAVNDGFHWSLF